MTNKARLAALEAVAEVARKTLEDAPNYSIEAARRTSLWQALRSLDAIPAPTPGQESRKIAQMVTGRDADDVCLEYALCTDGTAWLLQWEDCKPIGWKQLPPIPATVTPEVTP
jgi:hypothetical protein